MSEKRGLLSYETREILFYKIKNEKARMVILLF